MSVSARDALYDKRPLSLGFPELESVSTEVFADRLAQGTGHRVKLEYLLTLLGRLIDIQGVDDIAVVGCGPHPTTVRILNELGYGVTGVEPVEGYVQRAEEFLGGQGVVRLGSAEELPFPDRSQDVVLLESVLEHVDSPFKSLNEVYRVLVPGGIALVVTTNRQRFSPAGACAEFNVRFYNWLPALVKESYVFEHLHYRPELANHTPRPAVHWFSFAELCALGRAAGFAQFYSHLDLLRVDDPTVAGKPVKRHVLRWVQRKPWLRSLALTQVGGVIAMWKRRS